MYLAKISVSILTLSPFLSRAKLVSFAVCGISDTLNCPDVTDTTVRLTPLTAIEPCPTICPASFWEIAKLSTIAFSSLCFWMRVATLSTCPVTRCPSKRALAAIASSRFTKSPIRHSEKIVRLKVSGIISTVNV